ncbi:MAG: hypothetical protein ACXADC_11470 [Candidatus Thorarchaeota archaeon]|jgi:hypothetical protein
MSNQKRDGTGKPETGINKDTMYIESVDLLKLYSRSSSRLRVAVRIVDKLKRPIDMADVNLMVRLPSGNLFTVNESTEKDGVAFFELSGLENGKCDLGVSDVGHPYFKVNSQDLLTQWRSTSL